MQQAKGLMFSVDEFQQRLARTRERLRDRGVAGMLVHTPENMYYLSGYHTPGYYAYQTMLVPTDPAKPPVLVVRRLEESNVREFSWIDTRRVYTDTEDPIELTAKVVKESGLEQGTVAVEKSAWFLTVANLEALTRLLPKATFVDGSGVVEQGRVIKSPAEIAYIRKAARAAEAAMRAGLDATAAGRTEDEVAAEIYRAAILAGCEYTSLPQFIASGYRSSITHATWAGRRIEPGDVVYYELVGTVPALQRVTLPGGDDRPAERQDQADVRCHDRRPRARARDDEARRPVRRRRRGLGRRDREGRVRSAAQAGRLLDRHQFPARLGRGIHPQLEVRGEAGARAGHGLPRAVLHPGRGRGSRGQQRDDPRHRARVRGAHAFPRQHFVK